MASPDTIPISETARLALATAAPADRELWRSLFELDSRLGAIVRHAKEPMLSQLRLAWWRDELAKPVAERTKGDPVLDSIGRSWGDSGQALRDLADGCEALVGENPAGRSALVAFADGRAGACAAIARRLECDEAGAELSGRWWGYAECASSARSENERLAAMDLGRALPPMGLLPRKLRPLALVGGLSRRALRRGGAPLLGDRMSPLVAFRLGILGR